jgi:P27 family predicted phage terminase small subunit
MMHKKRLIRAPKGLAKQGKTLWERTMMGSKALQHDLELLESACRLLDRIHQCRELLATDGLTSRGRYGQIVMHPAIEIEARAMAEFRACLKMLGLHEQVPKGVML